MLVKPRVFIIILFLFLHLPVLLIATPVDDCGKLTEDAIVAAEQKDFITSLDLLSKAKFIAEENNLYLQQFWILTNMGINYAEMLDYSIALDNFLEAYKIAVKHLDTRNEMSILNNIAGLYYLDNKYEKAEEYYSKVYNYAKEINDSALLGGCALNMALISNESGLISEALEYLDTADEMLVSNRKALLKSASLRIYTFLINNEYQKAEVLALKLLPQLEEKELHDLKISVLIHLTRINYYQQHTDKAIAYAEQTMGSEINLENKMVIFELFSAIYQQRGEYIQAINYKDSVMHISAQIQQITDNKHFENNRIKFELLKNEQELLESKLMLKNERIVFIFIIIISLMLIWAFITNSIKIKQKNKIIELELEQEINKKLLMEKQYKEQEINSLLEKERLVNEQERLTHEIEKKNRELASKALFLSNRNELIENIVDSLSKSPQISGNQEVIANIQQLKIQLKNNTELDSFLSHFENINHNFIHKLKEAHPELTANEIRFLSYIYINLNPKEISSLLNITPEYCKKKRQQIAKKLNLTSTSQLYNYLSTFG